MRLNFLLLAGIVCLSLVASWFLVPRGRERAMMLLRGNQVEAALEVLDARRHGFVVDASNVSSLVRAYLVIGDIDSAIDVLSGYVMRNTQDVVALNRLGDLLSQDGRLLPYADNRLIVFHLTGNAEALHDYAGLMLFLNDMERRREALQLLRQHKLLEPDEALELAQRLATRGSEAEAMAVLDGMIAKDPKAADDLVLVNYARYALATNRLADLKRVTLQWLQIETKSGDVESFFATLKGTGGGGVVDDLLAAADSDPILKRHAESFAAVELASGKIKAAIARLTALEGEGRLSPEGRQNLFEAALGDSNLDLAHRAYRGLPQSQTNALLLVEAVEINRRVDILNALQASLTPEQKMREPFLAARLAFALGRPQDARQYIVRARERNNLSSAERLFIAQAMVQFGELSQGQIMLMGLAYDPLTPADALAELGDVYFQQGKYREGADFLAALREKRREPVVEQAWAKLAAAAGDSSAVRSWLQSRQPRDPQLLTDLYYIAGDARSYDLSLLAAQMLTQAQPGPGARLMQARTLLVLDRPREALVLLHQTPLPLDAETEVLTLQAMAAIGQDSGLVEWVIARLDVPTITPARRREMIGYLLDSRLKLPRQRERLVTAVETDLAAGNLDQDDRYARIELLQRLAPQRALPLWRAEILRNPAVQDRLLELLLEQKQKGEASRLLAERLNRIWPQRKAAEADLYSLIDVGGPEAALPYLKRAATEWRGDWVDSYQDALLKLGRRNELIAELRNTAAQDSFPAERRRAAGFRLLELNERTAAEAVFRQLAERQSPQSDDVQQLLFLWGPRPAADRLDWLERRARAATGAEQTIWLTQLQDRGGGDRVVALLTADEAAVLRDPARMDVLARQLVAMNRRPAAEDWMNRGVTAAGADSTRLEALLATAEAQGLFRASAAAALALAQAAPADRESRRRVAAASYAAGRKTDALKQYARYFEGGPGDWESHFNYAELLRGDNRRPAAREHYAKTLEIIERQRRPSLLAERSRVLALGRMGRMEEFEQQAARLLKDNPQDSDLRTDIASLYMDIGRFTQAEAILRP